MYFVKYTADNLTLNVELVEIVNGDLEDVADKLREVLKVVVVVAVDPPAGRGRAEDACQSFAAREVLVREVRGVQRREAALRVRSAARRGAAAAARDMALGGARSEPAGPPALFLSQSRTCVECRLVFRAGSAKGGSRVGPGV